VSPPAPQSVRSLDRALAGGLAWAAGAKSVTQVFNWAFTLIVAHKLSPSDFGLVNMAGFINVLTSTLAEFGMGQAVLQMPELEPGVVAQLNAACLSICLAAYALLVVASPLIAAFFHDDRVRLLVICNSVGLIITGLQSVPNGLLERDLDYRRLSVGESVTTVVQSAVTVGMAFAGFAYWSLVVGATAGRLAGAGLTYHWKPVPFAFPRWRQIHAPMRLGAHIAIGRIAFTAYTMADGVVVGRSLGGAALGAYQMAMSLANAPSEKIGTLIMRVTGPLFARVQKDRELVPRYFKIITESLSLAVFPLLVGLAVVAPDAVRVLLGPQVGRRRRASPLARRFHLRAHPRHPLRPGAHLAPLHPLQYARFAAQLCRDARRLRAGFPLGHRRGGRQLVDPGPGDRASLDRETACGRSVCAIAITAACCCRRSPAAP
jgi:O-antigen/teichoic acid export membrane protein